MCANHRTFYLCTVVLIVRSLMGCFAMHWLFYTVQVIEICVQSVMPAYWSLNNGRRELMASTSSPLLPPSPSPSTRSEICVQLLAAYSLLITLALSMTQQSFFKYLVLLLSYTVYFRRNKLEERKYHEGSHLEEKEYVCASFDKLEHFLK